MSGEFVAVMEDVLELYTEADDPERPRFNFDECPVESRAEAREPMRPAGAAKLEFHYTTRPSTPRG